MYECYKSVILPLTYSEAIPGSTAHDREVSNRSSPHHRNITLTHNETNQTYSYAYASLII